MNEQWRTIEDFEDYAVSSLGRIKRLTRAPHTHPGRLLRSFLKRDGYLHVNLRSDGKLRTVAVHRVVASVFLGAPPFAGAQVAHGDGSRTNNAVANLRWATCVENHADRERHGRTARGSRCGTAVLTEAQVLAIRRLLSSGTPQRAVAVQFGVSPALISNINTRKLWRHI